MKISYFPLLLLLAPPLVGGCTLTRGAAPPQAAAKEKPVLVIPAVPVTKDWQVKERAPDLTDERGRLPFQTEQSVQPEGAAPTTPAERQKIETPRQ